MRTLAAATYEDYVWWYLKREKYKGRQFPWPGTAEEALTCMREVHWGKLRPWFPAGEWSIVRFEQAWELELLVFMHSEQTVTSGLLPQEGPKNFRLLGRVVENALADGCLAHKENARIAHYVSCFQAGSLSLVGESRLVICSSNKHEMAWNPAGRFYLHDGSARALAYLVHLRQGGTGESPVEAFLVRGGEG